MEDRIAQGLGAAIGGSAEDYDYYAAPSTQVFAFIGLLWLSLKIFSFWRMIASLFVLPGKDVSTKYSHFDALSRS